MLFSCSHPISPSHIYFCWLMLQKEVLLNPPILSLASALHYALYLPRGGVNATGCVAEMDIAFGITSERADRNEANCRVRDKEDIQQYNVSSTSYAKLDIPYPYRHDRGSSDTFNGS